MRVSAGRQGDAQLHPLLFDAKSGFVGVCCDGRTIQRGGEVLACMMFVCLVVVWLCCDVVEEAISAGIDRADSWIAVRRERRAIVSLRAT